MARTKQPAQKRETTITTMRLPDDLLKRLASVGRGEGRSRTNMAEVILLEGVKKRERSRGVLG